MCDKLRTRRATVVRTRRMGGGGVFAFKYVTAAPISVLGCDVTFLKFSASEPNPYWPGVRFNRSKSVWKPHETTINVFVYHRPLRSPIDTFSSRDFQRERGARAGTDSSSRTFLLHAFSFSCTTRPVGHSGRLEIISPRQIIVVSVAKVETMPGVRAFHSSSPPLVRPL